jgi:Protein of unknown function (DUF2946)
MRRLRSIRRFGAGLGLFALLLQLALSFDHVHPEDLLGASATGIAEKVAGKAQPARTEQNRHVPGAPHDDCPICAVMHLAGTIVLPAPPGLALPSQFTVAVFSTDDLVAVVVPRRPPFQTRAPPIA